MLLEKYEGCRGLFPDDKSKSGSTDGLDIAILISLLLNQEKSLLSLIFKVVPLQIMSNFSKKRRRRLQLYPAKIKVCWGCFV